MELLDRIEYRVCIGIGAEERKSLANFDKIVAVKFGEEWVPVDSADIALNCLRELWPDKSGPSYQRAVRNCEAHLAGEATVLAARASFMVAAMETGLPFDVYPDHLAFMDVQIASVAKQNAVIDRDDIGDDAKAQM